MYFGGKFLICGKEKNFFFFFSRLLSEKNNNNDGCLQAADRFGRLEVVLAKMDLMDGQWAECR